MVSVTLLTYNHADYVRQTLEGIVKQKTNFKFEVIVGDDCSKDSTQEILREYGEKYPDIFNMVLRPENIGATKNLYDLLKRCKGKYIAGLEGDDYWTDPLKLQKQIDILESNSDLIACVTNTCKVDKKGNLLEQKKENVVQGNKEGIYDIYDFFKMPQHQYPTATIVYRAIHQNEIRSKYSHTENPFLGDWTLWIILHSYGKFYYLDEVTAAYRTNPTSLTHTVNRVARAKASREICHNVADVLPEQYADIAADLRKTNWVWISLIFAYRAEKRYFGMFGSFIMAAILCPKALWKTIKEALHKRSQH